MFEYLFCLLYDPSFSTLVRRVEDEVHEDSDDLFVSCTIFLLCRWSSFNGRR